MDANQADMKLVADLATKSVTPTVIKDEREHFIVLPEGAEIRSLRDFQFAEPPLKKAGKVTAEDVPSFAAYFQRFRDDDSMIFGLPEKFTFTGILDYHIAKDGAAREKAHQVILELRQTARWKTWKGNNKTPMAQEQFAQFIEDNLPDIYAPDGTDYPPAAVMLEVSRSLQASSSYQFNQATNLKNGQRGLTYREQIEGVAGPAGELKIPDAFIVRIPIFLNQKPVEIICRLRFRIQGGKLSMWYDMLRVDEMLAAEFETARAAVAAAAECEVLLGAA
jgi:uncharacterized protein YfdQ (DUF2303 family)